MSFQFYDKTISQSIIFIRHLLNELALPAVRLHSLSILFRMVFKQKLCNF